MKIKFIHPIKLIRTKDCFFYKGNLIYDKNEKIKSPKDYENKNLTSGIFLVYEKEDLKAIDFNKYYQLYYPCDDIKIMEYKESKGELFKIDYNDNEKGTFRAIKNRLYYEFYNE